MLLKGAYCVGEHFVDPQTTMHQQTDVQESITKQDRNNINYPQKKHRLETVSQIFLLEVLNRFNGHQPHP